MRKEKAVISLACLVALFLAFSVTGVAEGDLVFLWAMDTEEEIAGYGHDNTGTRFVLNDRYVRQGTHSVEVIPTGQAAETKLALELSGAKLNSWNGNDELVMDVYIPEDNEPKPNMFFLGMANVTGEWAWVDGVFAKAEVKSGWNQVRYPLSGAMNTLDENGKYMLYFAFAFNKPDNSKVPLQDSFYIDGISLVKNAPVKADESSSTAAGVGKDGYVYTMDTKAEVASFSNDNTGAGFALNDEKVFQGTHSAAVIPSGQAVETKIALDLMGERLKLWGGKEVILNVYLPPENELHPNMFFMGMADVTGEWKWVGGVFSNTEAKPGWNQIVYVLPDEMTNLDPDRKYKLYFAFGAVKEGGEKVPLTETFYVDGLKTEVSVITREDLLSRVSTEIRNEVAALLDMGDEELREAISKKAFDYFWHEANPDNGLIKDRSTKDSPCSIAAVGFGLTAIPVGVERGWITREAGYDRVLTTLKTFANGGVEGKNGFFYHFVDMKNGRRYGDSELSSIDTALFLAGAIFAGEYFKGTDVEQLAKGLYENTNWQWMMNGGDTLSMGWKPEGGFLNARWNAFNESMVMYIMAIGSPTYPIPVSAWDSIYRPVNDNYISLPEESLFIYQYSHAWVDFRSKEDKYANYWNNSVIATRINRIFCAMRRFAYKTYDMDIWGLSASDGPAGYRAYGASEGNHDGTIAPYASISSIPFTPELSMAAARAMLRQHGPLIWGRYGFTSAFNVDQNWYSDQYIGIDQGDILLMLENYRSGFVWEYFMRNKSIQRGMELIGFREKEADYAVTPWYAAEFEKMRLAPKDKKAVAVFSEEPVKVDGSLTEWKGLDPYLVTEDMNVPAGGLEKVDKRKQILNSKFYVKWDEEYLYLAADVSDEFVVTNIAPGDLGGFYRTDSIEFYIDPGRAGSNAGLYKLAVLPFDTSGSVQAVRHEDADPGPVGPDVKVASARTNHGYVVEVAIPFVDLGLTPKSGLTVGFSHTIHNSNDEDASVGQYVRTNLIAWNNLPEVWNSPELWGELVLQ